MPPASTTSKSAHTPTAEPKPTRQRPPPPTLFQAPPQLSLPPLSRSPNASHTSLLLPSANPTTTNATANPTAAAKPPSHRPTPSNADTDPNPAATATADADADADALWRAMQHTLAEVELTAAAARNAHIFGAQHAAALAQLRGAQIGLAQAWGRGSGGEGEGMDSVVEGTETGVDARGTTEGAKKDEGGGDGGSKGTGTGTGTGEKGRARSGSVLAEETRSDLLLARKRREANDRYFARVKESVGDVVERLEAVAGAMRSVERESRDVWSSGGESSVGISAGASAGGSASAGAGGD